MVTLAEEEPFAAVVEDDDLAVVCSSCFKMQQNPAILPCAGCHVLRYCSKKCQQNDWINHKSECRLLKKCYDAPSTMCRLITRISKKLEKSDAQAAAFNGRRYEDLMDHRNEICNDIQQLEKFRKVLYLLRGYMGEKHIPDESILLSIYGKVTINAIGIKLNNRKIGLGVYIGLSAQDHSCAPDAHVIFHGSKAILRSTNKDMKYSKDVTISYIPVFATKSRRHEMLSSKYYFTCSCSVCADPQQDFIYNCIRSTCCPDSYCLLDPSATELKCVKCGLPSKITVKEAIAANDEIVSFRSLFDDILGSSSAHPVLARYSKTSHVNRLTQECEKFSKVLSPFNINLLHITDTLFDIASQLDNFTVCKKYAQCILSAYKRYWHVGHPDLTHRLLYLSRVLEAAPTPSGNVLKWLDEALASSMISHGPDHPVTKFITQGQFEYSMKLLQIRNS